MTMKKLLLSIFIYVTCLTNALANNKSCGFNNNNFIIDVIVYIENGPGDGITPKSFLRFISKMELNTIKIHQLLLIIAMAIIKIVKPK